MILTLKTGVSKKEADKIIARIKELGFQPSISKGAERIVIGVIGEKAIVHKSTFEVMDGVEMVTPISKPYKLVSREFKKESTVVTVGKNVKIGGKQYVVSEKETLLVDLLQEGTKELSLDALLVIDGEKTTVGTPTVKGVKVTAKVVEDEVKGDKIRVIRYKTKKRVHKETGHRQKYSKIEITSIK